MSKEEDSIFRPNQTLKEIFIFLIGGPEQTDVSGIVLWLLLFPVTLPLFVVGQISVGFAKWMKEVKAQLNGDGKRRSYSFDYYDYDDEGLFDEVSTARREDLEFLMGTGKYSDDNW